MNQPQTNLKQGDNKLPKANGLRHSNPSDMEKFVSPSLHPSVNPPAGGSRYSRGQNKKSFAKKKIGYRTPNILRRRFFKKNPASAIRTRSFGGRK